MKDWKARPWSCLPVFHNNVPNEFRMSFLFTFHGPDKIERRCFFVIGNVRRLLC